MCDFVIVGIREGHPDALRQALPEGIYLDALDCPAAAQVLPEGYAVTALVTSNHCSCGLYFDPQEVAAERLDDRGRRHDARARKYRRLGWSAAKIERALADSAAATTEAHLLVGEAKLQQVEAAVTAAAAATPGGLFVVVHQFSGSIAEERFDIRLEEAPRGHLRLRPSSIPEDCLVHIVGVSPNPSLQRTPPG